MRQSPAVKRSPCISSEPSRRRGGSRAAADAVQPVRLDDEPLGELVQADVVPGQVDHALVAREVELQADGRHAAHVQPQGLAVADGAELQTGRRSAGITPWLFISA